MHTHEPGPPHARGARVHSHGAGRHSHGAGQHSHGTGEESYAARPHPEHVVLDIGEDVGALIVHTDVAMLGIEVEISPTGHDDRRSHKEVLQREINGQPAYTAVFDKLPEGTYTLWVNDRARAREVAIQGATVAELDWSCEPPAAG
jgi:hypothetical protein